MNLNVHDVKSIEVGPKRQHEGTPVHVRDIRIKAERDTIIITLFTNGDHKKLSVKYVREEHLL